VLITDEEFAKKVKQFKTMKIHTKRTLVAIGVFGVIAIILALFVGEAPALVAAALSSLAVGGLTIEILIGMRLIGPAALYSLYKVYDVQVDQSGAGILIRRLK